MSVAVSDKIITSRANGYVDFAIEVAKKMNLFKDEEDLQETYYLNGKEVPTIPVPHDCIVKDIKLDDGNLVFGFEDANT